MAPEFFLRIWNDVRHYLRSGAWIRSNKDLERPNNYLRSATWILADLPNKVLESLNKLSEEWHLDCSRSFLQGCETS